MDDIGLTQLGHSMSLYRKLLGKPVYQFTNNASDPYLSHVDKYVLPIWPSFAFSVYGSKDEITSCVKFSSLPDEKPIRSMELTPWNVIEEQIQNYLSSGKVVDEWYPMKDYMCSSTKPLPRLMGA